MTTRFVLYREAAERLTALGVPITVQSIHRWVGRHPDMKRKVGGRYVLPATAFEMLIEGKSLREVAETMRAQTATEQADDWGNPGRE